MRHFLSKKFAIFTVFFLLVSTFSFSLAPVAQSAAPNQLNTYNVIPVPAEIFGNYVVWVEGDPQQVVYKNLSQSGSEQKVHPTGYNQISPAIFGNTVVWQENSDIHAKVLPSGPYYRVTNSSGLLKTSPAIYENRVVWAQWDGSKYQIYSKNLSDTGNGTPLSPDPNSTQTSPVIFGDYVVWENRPLPVGDSNLKVRKLSTNTTYDLVTASSDQISPAIYGTIVAWTHKISDANVQNNRQIYYYDLANGMPANPSTAGTQVSATPSVKDHPVVFANRIVWEDYPNSWDLNNPNHPTTGVDLYMKDLTTGSEGPIVSDVGRQEWPAMHADKVVWLDTDTYSVRFLKTTTPVTLFATGFEPGAKPDSWNKPMTDPASGWDVGYYPPWNGGNQQGVYWGESNYKAKTGTQSAWAAGTRGDITNHLYANNMNAYARRTVDLRGFTDGTLTFWYNIPSIPPYDQIYQYDFGEVIVYDPDVGAQWPNDYHLFTNTTSGWVQKTIDLKRYAGASRVIIEWRWISDNINQAEGMYIDDVSITASTNFPLSGLSISPTTATLIAGGTPQTFQATGADVYGFPVGTSNFTWTTLPTTGVTITQDPNDSSKATLTAQAVGSYSVTATSGSFSASASVQVNPAVLDHITVTLDRATVTAGGGVAGTAQATARGYDQYNNWIYSLTSFTWFIVPPAGETYDPTKHGTIDSTGKYVSGTKAGTYIIQAKSGTITGSTTIQVDPGALTSVTVTPATATIPENGTLSLSAQGYDNQTPPNPISSNMTYNWTIESGSGTVSPASGASTTFTPGASAGTTTVKVSATKDGVTKTNISTINITGSLDRIDLIGTLNNQVIYNSNNPSPVLLDIGNRPVFTGYGYDAAGHSLPGLSFNWTATGGTLSTQAGTLTTYTAGTTAGSNYTLQASSGPRFSPVVNITIKAGILDKYYITHENPPGGPVDANSTVNIPAGSSDRFTVWGQDAKGNNIEGLDYYWSSMGGFGTLSPANPTQTVTYTAGPRVGVKDVLKVYASVDPARWTGPGIYITPGLLNSITISPFSSLTNPIQVKAGGTLSLSATGYDALGNQTSDTNFTWSTNGGSVDAGPGSSTTFYAPTTVGGTYTVTATASGKTGTAWVKIIPGDLDFFETSNITSPKTTGQVNFTIKAKDKYYNDITTWNGTVSLKDNNTGATGSATLTNGVNPAASLTITKPTTNDFVTATAATGPFGTTNNFDVIPGPVKTIDINPPYANPQIGDQKSFYAQGRDQYGNPISNLTYSWSVTGGGWIETTSNSSAIIFHATTNGSFQLSATAADRGSSAAGSATIAVGGTFDRINVTPSSATLQTGGSQAFSAQGYDQYNNAIAGLTYTWTATGGSVSPGTGSSTTYTAGSTAGSYQATATASYGGSTKSGSSSITIGSPPPQVTGLSVTDPQTGGTLNLSWSAASTATSYKIYRSTASGTEGYLTTTSSTSYQNTGLTNGTRYYYKVSGVNQYGEGPLSAEASGIPTTPLPFTPTQYWFTWYDELSPGMRNWVLIANPSSSQAISSASVYLGTSLLGSYPSISAGSMGIYEYPGKIGGPVRVGSTGPALVSQRVTYNGSFNEVIGVPDSKLSTQYYFTWYDAQSMRDWILVGNPTTNTSAAQVEIWIGGVRKWSGQISPGQNVIPEFPGLMGGPVIIKSTNGVKIFTSQRTIYQGAFNEVMGIPQEDLSTSYYFTWYDNQWMKSWVLVGNPNSTTANITITIGGTPVFTGPVPANGKITPQFSVPANGPVKVTSDIPIFTSERSLYGTNSFEELPGLPTSSLSTNFWFTWYDNQWMKSWVLVGNPNSTTANITITIGGTPVFTGPVPANGKITPQFSVPANGPVKVQSDVPVFSSERSLYGASFSEIFGASF